jgi:hypothetical protein
MTFEIDRISFNIDGITFEFDQHLNCKILYEIRCSSKPLVPVENRRKIRW